MTTTFGVRVFLFAGGQSSRFWPFNSMLEKTLLPLPDGIPIIRQLYNNLVEANSPFEPKDVVILCHGRHANVFAHEFRDTDARINPAPEFLGTLGHLSAATKAYPDDTYLVHYADMVTDVNYDRLVTYHKNHTGQATIVTYKVQTPYSEVNLGTGNLVESFAEKPWVASPIWTGIGLFNKEAILPMVGEDIGRHLLPALAARDVLMAYHHNGKWVDLGTVDSYRKYVG